MKKWLEKLEKIFTAVTFAEADCHDMALEILGHRKNHGQKESLNLFIENVGLKNVRVSYVMAKV